MAAALDQTPRQQPMQTGRFSNHVYIYGTDGITQLFLFNKNQVESTQIICLECGTSANLYARTNKGDVNTPLLELAYERIGQYTYGHGASNHRVSIHHNKSIHPSRTQLRDQLKALLGEQIMPFKPRATFLPKSLFQKHNHVLTSREIKEIDVCGGCLLQRFPNKSCCVCSTLSGLTAYCHGNSSPLLVLEEEELEKVIKTRERSTQSPSKRVNV